MRTAIVVTGAVLAVLLAWLGYALGQPAVGSASASDVMGQPWVLSATPRDGITHHVPPGQRRPSVAYQNGMIVYYDGCAPGSGKATISSGYVHTEYFAVGAIACPTPYPVPIIPFDDKPQLILHDGWLEVRHNENRWAFDRSTPANS